MKDEYFNEFLDHEQDRANSHLCDTEAEGGGMIYTQKKLTYFADDGNYGTCDVVLLFTDNWTDQDWLEISEATDSNRIDVAMAIDSRKKGSQ